MVGIGLYNLVNLVLPAGGAAVKAVAKVVPGQLDQSAVDGNLPLVDAVCIPADGCAKIRQVVLREVILDLIKAKNHILHITILVRNADGNYASAEVGDAYLHA